MTRPGYPSFSIVVPTFQRPRQLASLLAALTRLDYPRDCFEVVVVDDGSQPPVEATVEPLRDRLRVVLVRQANAGPSAARNAGARAAGGAYLAFTDDDCEPEPGWLRAFAEHLASRPDDLVGGRTVNALPDNLLSSAAHHIVDLVHAYYNPDPEHATFFASNNFALPAAGLAELGGFDMNFVRAAAEDRDLCARWLASGRRMSYAPRALVRHAHPLSLRTFWRLYFNYGRGAYIYHARRAQRGACRGGVELKFHAAALSSPLRAGAGGRRLPLMGLMLLWQVANAAGFACELVQHRREVSAAGRARGRWAALRPEAARHRNLGDLPRPCARDGVANLSDGAPKEQAALPRTLVKAGPISRGG